MLKINNRIFISFLKYTPTIEKKILMKNKIIIRTFHFEDSKF
jgi:hypothetical protein